MPSSKTPDLDIVIVNWNAGALLDRCLESIAASEGREQFLSRIILVDNASSDGSTEGLERHGLPLHLLKQTKNLGYGRAADLGARTAEATFLLFLNPDIRLKGDSLRRSLERLTALEESLARPPAILGVALLDEDGTVSRSCARFPSAGQQFAESLGLTRLLPEAFKPTIMTDWDHGFSREVDHVMGAFALMRRQHYLDLGGLPRARGQQLLWKRRAAAQTAGGNDRSRARRLPGRTKPPASRRPASSTPSGLQGPWDLLTAKASPSDHNSVP